MVPAVLLVLEVRLDQDPLLQALREVLRVPVVLQDPYCLGYHSLLTDQLVLRHLRALVVLWVLVVRLVRDLQPVLHFQGFPAALVDQVVRYRLEDQQDQDHLGDLPLEPQRVLVDQLVQQDQDHPGFLVGRHSLALLGVLEVLVVLGSHPVQLALVRPVRRCRLSPVFHSPRSAPGDLEGLYRLGPRPVPCPQCPLCSLASQDLQALL